MAGRVRQSRAWNQLGAGAVAVPGAVTHRAQVYLVTDEQDRVAMVPVGACAGWLASVIWSEILLAQRTGTWSRLKLCREPGCVSAFYDASRNGSGVWHNVRSCGNVANLRASRARKKKHTAADRTDNSAGNAARRTRRDRAPERANPTSWSASRLASGAPLKFELPSGSFGDRLQGCGEDGVEYRLGLVACGEGSRDRDGAHDRGDEGPGRPCLFLLGAWHGGGQGGDHIEHPAAVCLADGVARPRHVRAQ